MCKTNKYNLQADEEAVRNIIPEFHELRGTRVETNSDSAVP